MALTVEKDNNIFVIPAELYSKIEWIKLEENVLEIKLKEIEKTVKHQNVTKLQWN